MSTFWKDRRTLVTGGTGLVGGWLVQQLLADGADVVCLVRDWVPSSPLLRTGAIARVKIVRGDVCDQAVVDRTLAEYEIETVLHLAAQAIVGVANREPLSTFEANIRGTWTILESCRLSQTVKQVVISSSDKAYGSHERLPYDESMPLRGRHPYDVSKACADLIGQSYAITYGLLVGITRCGNLYGGGDLNWNRIVPGTIRSALKGERPIVRSDGTSIREYMYVQDAVFAYTTLAEALASRPELAGEAFNFGHRRPWTVAELVRKILDACGRPDLEPDIRAEATNEIPRQYLDPSKAMRELRWQPRFTLRRGLAETVAWYREFLGVPG